MDQHRGVVVLPGGHLAHRVPPEGPHLLAEGQVLPHILGAAMVLPPTVLEMPDTSHTLGGRVGQLQGGGGVRAGVRAELLGDGEVSNLQG